MLAVVAVLAVIAAGVAGVLLLGGSDNDGSDNGGSTDGGTALTQNPSLRRVPFPDPAALNFSDGPEATCESVSRSMAARGYQFEATAEENGDVDCSYATPAASTLGSDSYSVTALVSMTVGASAADTYDAYLSTIQANRGDGSEDSGTTWGSLYAYPAGEEGWIVHSQSTDRGDAVAAFRKGEATYYLHLLGSHAGAGGWEPLTEEVALQEISDIVTALGGDDASAGEPLISESVASEYPGDLEDFGDLTLPTQGGGEERCAAVTAVATEQLATMVAGTNVDDDLPPDTTTCAYEPDSALYGTDDYVGTRWVRVSMEDYTRTDSDPYADHGHQLKNTWNDRGTLYDLPTGTSGYMFYESAGEYGELEAAWVAGDYYLLIELKGSYEAGEADARPLTEEELVDQLTRLLNAMSG